ncbi:leucine--tRNA ligase [Candidatus Woesearchaeota archaeon]|nr:leucine--tRNA ligase [Candidatus Woesearchaeota archaeon]
MVTPNNAEFLQNIQSKWQKKWQQARSFHADANPYHKKKFFLTFPYPYINGLPHVGHLFTIMRVEAFARYKRLQGFNVLFPQGWHATGSPIVDAAQRVREGEEKQLKILRDCGVPEADISKFAEPEHWISYFVPEYRKDIQSLGLSIDWRREFFTTELNPHYNKFVQWQFSILKKKGYVKKGKFPVVWDPKNNCPVPDHSRIEGEGETPQEFLLVKHKLKNGTSIVTATLRPDTILGVTNLYINPDVMYVRAKVDEEDWIISKKVAKALADQDKKVTVIEEVQGSSLIGQTVLEFSGLSVPILPAFFVQEQFGTGIVHSVPSDSADDLIALDDLKKDTALCQKYRLDMAMVKAVEPISVLDVPGFSPIPARDVLTQLGIKSQHDRQKLEKAKDILYKKAFYEGKVNKLYQKARFKGLSQDYAGQPVEKAKEGIKHDILNSEFGDVYYQLTGRVVSRSMMECVVRIVEDQWFLDYGDPVWKKLAHDALNNLTLYPEKARAQFTYVIDWLHQWACTRETGLGTRLPWDEKWLIESLSDSTVYMAYYTIVHLLQKIDVRNVNGALFDYVFLDENTGKLLVDKKDADAMRREFDYWYPVDFRNSGKDLIQNHLTFYLFNHTAIFHKDKWPKGIGVNGWVTVDGSKMSKSLGNVIPVREMVKTYSADAARITILTGGEGMDDPNWDTEFARSIIPKLEQFYTLARDVAAAKDMTTAKDRAAAKGTAAGETSTGKTSTDGGRYTMKPIDLWALSNLHQIIHDATALMEETSFRSAIQKIFFDLQRLLRWYLRRTKNSPNTTVIKELVDAQAVMLSPFTPHLCEEIWSMLGKKGLACEASWPVAQQDKIDEQANAAENLVQETAADIQSVLKLLDIQKPASIALFVSPAWKYQLFAIVRKQLDTTRNPAEVLAAVMKNAPAELRSHGQDISKLIPKLVQGGLPPMILPQEKELAALRDAVDFLSAEAGCPVQIASADEASEPKAKQAQPGKVAIVVKQ